MSQYQRISGNLYITNVSSTDNVLITTHTVKVFGNLDVVGNVTYIETSELKVDDPFILVAGNNAGTFPNSGVPFTEQGLVTQTSANTYAGLRFDNITQTWQISPDVNADGSEKLSAPYETLGVASAGTVGGPLYSVQYHDVGNVFGGNAFLSVDVANAQLVVDGAVTIEYTGQPSYVPANASVIYREDIGIGGTGLYVYDGDAKEQELVGKTKALIFSLIF